MAAIAAATVEAVLTMMPLLTTLAVSVVNRPPYIAIKAVIRRDGHGALMVVLWVLSSTLAKTGGEEPRGSGRAGTQIVVLRARLMSPTSPSSASVFTVCFGSWKCCTSVSFAL